MKKSNLSSLASVTSALIVIMFSSIAQAQVPELPDVNEACAPEVSENRRASIAHAGVAGVWFHGDVARCMLGRLTALPLYARRVGLLEDRLQVSDERTALLNEAIQLGDQQQAQFQIALEAAVRRAREAEEERDAWYRHPALWFVVGGVIVAALVAVGAYALSAVRI